MSLPGGAYKWLKFANAGERRGPGAKVREPGRGRMPRPLLILSGAGAHRDPTPAWEPLARRLIAVAMIVPTPLDLIIGDGGR